MYCSVASVLPFPWISCPTFLVPGGAGNEAAPSSPWGEGGEGGHPPLGFLRLSVEKKPINNVSLNTDYLNNE